jgi:hypothetical protein
MNQVHIDIEKRIIDKLALWLTDSFALCEMAEMRKSTATAIIMRALMYCLLTGFAKKASDKADVMEVISTNWDLLINSRKEQGL